MLRAFRAEAKPGVAERRRTVAELLAKVEAHRERRERAEAERATKAKKGAAAAKNKRLDGLAKRGDAVWKEKGSVFDVRVPGEARELHPEQVFRGGDVEEYRGRCEHWLTVGARNGAR